MLQVIIGSGLTPNTTKTRILYNADNDGCGIFLPNDVLNAAGLVGINKVELYKNDQTKELIIVHPAAPVKPQSPYIFIDTYSLREPNVNGVGKVVRIPKDVQNPGKDVAVAFGLVRDNSCKYSVFGNPLYLVPRIDASNMWIIIRFP